MKIVFAGKLLIIILIFLCLSSLIAQNNPLPVYNTTGFTDELSVLLADGDIVQIIYAGPDDAIDVPIKDIGGANNGQPTDDDEILTSTIIGPPGAPPGFGLFYISITAYPNHAAGYPAVGDYIYVRVFNDNNLVNATYYGDAQLHYVNNVLGDEYIASSTQTDFSLPVELVSFQAYPGNNQVTLQWKTASELENLGFIVLKRPQDQEQYEIVSSYTDNTDLEGAGNSSEEHKYHYLDDFVKNGIEYHYKIESVDLNGSKFEYDEVSAIPNVNLVNRNNFNLIPEEYELRQNYPNPFNPDTKIEFGIPENQNSDKTSLIVYNILGQKVKKLFKGNLQPGYYYINWNGTDDNGQRLGTGMYIFYMKNGSFQQVKKMMLIN